MFYELYENDSKLFPKGAQFFFNVLIALITVPSKATDILPSGIEEYWYIEAITQPKPYAYVFMRDPSIIDPNVEFEWELIPHCVVQINPNQQVRWYELVDYETEDPWDLTPIYEDFDYEDEDDSEF